MGEEGKGGTCGKATKDTLTEGASVLYKEKSTGRRKKIEKSRGGRGSVDGDQREFDLETRVTTNGNRIISEMFHSCALNK